MRPIEEGKHAREASALCAHAAVVQGEVSRGAHSTNHFKGPVKGNAEAQLPRSHRRGDARGGTAVNHHVIVHRGGRGG